MVCCFRQPRSLHRNVKIESNSQLLPTCLDLKEIVIFTCLPSSIDDILKHQI